LRRLASLREQVHRAHQDVVRHHPVAWTSGNVSGRDPETGLAVIKPSGVRYADLTPEAPVIVDRRGR